MLSRRPDVLGGSLEDSKPLLWLAAMEACELVWTDAQISERIDVATSEDTTLKPILAFFMNGSDWPQRTSADNFKITK